MSECNYLCNFNTITVYPACLYLFYVFYKKYIKPYSLSVLDNIDMYDNTYEYKNTDNNYYNYNVLFAFNQIPT